MVSSVVPFAELSLAQLLSFWELVRDSVWRSTLLRPIPIMTKAELTKELAASCIPFSNTSVLQRKSKIRPAYIWAPSLSCYRVIRRITRDLEMFWHALLQGYGYLH